MVSRVERMAGGRASLTTREERERTMLRDEDMWPRWPVLPLKRRQADNVQPGLLYSGQGPVVFLTYMYKLSSVKLTDVEHIRYENYEALRADGWVVD